MAEIDDSSAVAGEQLGIARDPPLDVKWRLIDAWLNEKYAHLGVAFPPFERNQDTAAVLWELANMNVAADTLIPAAVDFLRERREEYRAEAKRIGTIFEKARLATAFKEAEAPARELASAATTLRLNDTSLSSFLTVLERQENTINDLEDTVRQQQLISAQHDRAKMAALAKLNKLLKYQADMEPSKADIARSTQEHSEQTAFLCQKEMEYAARIRAMEKTYGSLEIEKNGIGISQLYALESMAQALEAEIAAREADLARYHDLPAELSQAKLKLKSAQEKLKLLEIILAIDSDDMQFFFLQETLVNDRERIFNEMASNILN